MNKFPYRGYTEKELRKMESTYYFLEMGGDFVSENGICSFTEKELSKLYNRTLNDLLSLAEDGSEKESKYAIDLIGSLRISCFRLH